MFGFTSVDSSLKTSFKRNFLQTAVFQVQFTETKVFFKNKAAIHNIFQKTYPRLNDSATNFQIHINKNETPIVNSNKSESFLLKTQDGKKTIIFNPTSIDLNIKGEAYKNFEEIAENEIKLIQQILKQYEVTHISRIAIRKVNAMGVLVQPNENLTVISNDLLNPDVSASFSFIPGGNNVVQNINSISYKSGDSGMNLKIGYNVPAQSPIGHFLCDIDRFDTCVIPVDGMDSLLMKINEEIFDVFMWFLNEKSIKFLTND